MVVLCTVCGTSLADASSRRKHMKRLHPEHVPTKSYFCSVCNREEENLALVVQHMNAVHGSNATDQCLCVYDMKVFPSREAKARHTYSEHDLPEWNMPRSVLSTNQPTISAMGGSARVYDIFPAEDDRDILELMLKKKNEIDQIVRINTMFEPQKVQFVVEVSMVKPVPDSRDEFTTMFAHSTMALIFGDSYPESKYFEAVDQIAKVIHNFSSHGSGWVIASIDKVSIKMAKVSPLRGSSFLPLPTELQKTSNLLNIRNYDQKCFSYCFTAAYHLEHEKPLKDHKLSWRERTSQSTYDSTNPHAYQPVGDFEYPMGFGQIKRFEDLNECRVNVFRHRGTKNELLPVRVSQKQTGLIVDLLLLSNENVHHYVLIEDLNKVIAKVKGTGNRISRNWLCRNCFHMCTSLERYRNHTVQCLKHEPAEVIMPSEEDKEVHFQKVEAKVFAPFVMYFDMESILKPVQHVLGNPEQSMTTPLERHVPCSYCLVVIERDNPLPERYSLERGPDAIEKFVKLLESLAKEYRNKKRQYPIFAGTAPFSADDAEQCWLCEHEFDQSDHKVLDHCHYSGKFLGYAHNKCNLDRRVANFIPIFAHNLQNYDMHHLIKHLQFAQNSSTFSVLPLNTEKYISLSIGVKVDEYITKTNQVKPLYEYFRFLDSYKFMNASLETLAKNLPREKFAYLDGYFFDQGEDVNLLCQKGFYPYSYMDSFERFQEKTLPARELWLDTLANGTVQLSEEEYQHALKVFNRFSCSSIGDYHDLYLTSDTLILACVFEEFRSVCYECYGLDCTYYYTASNLSGDAYLKICKADLHLLTNREHLEMAENLVRGGVSSVYAKRFVAANNKFIKGFDRSRPSTFLFMIDANNLYGGVMEKYPLPLRDFQWNNSITIEEVLSTKLDDDIGYVVEVDIEYPDALHEKHADFPMAPTKEIIESCWLSNYQKRLLEQNNVKTSHKQRKLVQTLFDKQRYTVHYLHLQLMVEQGLKVKAMHRVLQFKQAKWLQKYIVLNKEKRKQASNKFEEDFYKLMPNSAFGKNCESKRKRVNVTLINSADKLLQQTQKPEFAGFQIINDNIIAVSTKPNKIYWDKTTLVGAVILDIAKYYMYWAHYNVMKKHLKCTLLYSDTDSLLYEVQSSDLYQEIASNEELKAHFDFSNMPPTHPLYSTFNKKETLLFKDEFAGEILKEFAGLKPKLKSLLGTGN